MSVAIRVASIFLALALSACSARQDPIAASPDEWPGFVQEFADDYDHLVVWLDFPLSLGGAFAYEFGIKNEIQGIGQPIFDQSRFAGSNGRLRSYVQMGNLGRYPADPAQTFLGTNSTLDVLGQETGHRWLAFLRFKDGSTQSTDLLGRDLAHWSFFTDSDASDMEGNDIRGSSGSRPHQKLRRAS